MAVQRGSEHDSTVPLYARRFGEPALDAMFPLGDRAARLGSLIRSGGSVLDSGQPRFGERKFGTQESLMRDFGTELDDHPARDVAELVDSIASGFLTDSVNWRSPALQYNLGAPTTLPSVALYSIGLDANVYLINDGLAGNVIAAEMAVSSILSGLAGIPKSMARGLFVFGGTGTIAYAIRCGLVKSTPDIIENGVSKDTFVAVSEDAHFSHARSSRWLGLGSRQIEVLPVDEQRRTILDKSMAAIKARFDRGERLATIVLSGGTTYDHSVDDVVEFRQFVEDITRQYKLDYQPHIHVDSVIGWEWLVFRGAKLEEIKDLDSRTVRLLGEQAALVSSAVQAADSWGVDFHKGAGASPIDCSMVQFNDGRDLGYLNGSSPLAEMHQLASELSSYSPAEHTLETSRAGAKALAALGSLHALGVDGYQAVLAGLVEGAQVFRDRVKTYTDIDIMNPHSRGYSSMVRMFPPQLAGSSLRATEGVGTGPEQANYSREVNQYIRAFVDWDETRRMSVGGAGPYYSYTSKFRIPPSGVGLAAVKFYPTSPRLSNAEADGAAVFLAEAKAQFDREHATT